LPQEQFLGSKSEAGRLPAVEAGEIKLSKGKTRKRYLMDPDCVVKLLRDRAAGAHDGDK